MPRLTGGGGFVEVNVEKTGAEGGQGKPGGGGQRS